MNRDKKAELDRVFSCFTAVNIHCKLLFLLTNDMVNHDYAKNNDK